MKRTVHLVIVVATLATAPLATAADGIGAFGELSQHYESIRQALMKDSTDGVSEHALDIRDVVAALEGDFSAERAGVSPDDADTVRSLLPEIQSRAGDLAATSGLENVRGAFSELTKPLVRWQSMVTGDRPIVAYCPMVKRPWLQPDGAIGNPYDSSMLRCGEVVSR